MARDIAYGIDSLRSREERTILQARLDGSIAAAVQAVAMAFELRDPYTAGHQRRVADLAGDIAVEMGIDSEVIAGVRVGASIHDVGKLTVPAEILSKPGPLTPVEMDLVKLHPQAGCDIVAGIQFPWPVREMLLQHHERLDGSGYPNGLSGDEIVIEARIIAVADTVEDVLRSSLPSGTRERHRLEDGPRGAAFCSSPPRSTRAACCSVRKASPSAARKVPISTRHRRPRALRRAATGQRHECAKRLLMLPG